MGKRDKSKEEILSEISDLHALANVSKGKGHSLFLDALFSMDTLMLAWLDVNFNFIRVSQGYAKADERLPSFFVGKNHFDLYPDKENEATFNRVLKTGEGVVYYGKPFEYSEHPGMGVTYWNWELLPLREESGEVEGLLLALANVTAHKKAEQRFLQSELRYQKLLEQANDAIFIADVETGFIIEANKKAVELLGKPLNDIIGMHQSELHPAEDADRYMYIFNKHLKLGSVISEEIYVIHESGSRIPVEVSASVIELEGKKVIQGIFRKIKDRL